MSSRPIGSLADMHTGPLSRPAVRRMIETPVCASPAMIARSIGAAPLQRGSSEGWTFSRSCSESSGSLMSAPNAQTMTVWRAPAPAPRSRPLPFPSPGLRDQRPACGSLTLSGCSRGIASARALSATGGEASCVRGRDGRSGRVMTSAGRWASVRARRSRIAAANSEVPRKTVLKVLDPRRAPARRRSPSPGPRASRAWPPCAPRARCGRE